MARKKGWPGEPARHSLASRGLCSRPKSVRAPAGINKLRKLDFDLECMIMEEVEGIFYEPDIGDCVTINTTVAEYLRWLIGDEENQTGKVYVAQGKALLDQEVTDYRDGDRSMPYETDEPDHVFLVINPRSRTWKGDDEIDAKLGTGEYEIWDFASNVFGDAHIHEYVFTETLGYYKEIDENLLARLKELTPR